MTTDEGQHVFISYVREDKERVDRLCEMLKGLFTNEGVKPS